MNKPTYARAMSDERLVSVLRNPRNDYVIAVEPSPYPSLPLYRILIDGISTEVLAFEVLAILEESQTAREALEKEKARADAAEEECERLRGTIRCIRRALA